MLNVFQGGGPLDDGLAYDTRYLLQAHPKVNRIVEYRWTGNVFTGPSGKLARIWKWKGSDAKLGS